MSAATFARAMRISDEFSADAEAFRFHPEIGVQHHRAHTFRLVYCAEHDMHEIVQGLTRAELDAIRLTEALSLVAPIERVEAAVAGLYGPAVM